MKKYSLLVVLAMLLSCTSLLAREYLGSSSLIRYVGRIELSGSQSRLWTSGSYAEFGFNGDTCTLVLEDQFRYGVMHSYVEVVIDNETPIRLRLNERINTLVFVPKKHRKQHRILVCKDTETGTGFVGVNSIVVDSMFQLPERKKYLFEFFGDSITCGASSDTSSVGCHLGRWEDQHNAYMSYGAQASRMSDADWVLSSVSGIGLMHSCCGMTVVMPEVWDKMGMRDDSIDYHFDQYRPAAIFVCLGQNDGMQDTIAFQKNYISFLQKIRTKYNNQPIVLLTSPMSDSKLRPYLEYQLSMVVEQSKQLGIQDVHTYFFKGTYTNGCDWHPSVTEHTAIAKELVSFLKSKRVLH